MAMLGTAAARVTLDASNFVAGAAKVASASSQMESAVNKSGSGLGDKILANSGNLTKLGLGLGVAGAGITAFFYKAQKTANDFGREMANVNSIAQVDTKTLAGMSSQVEGLAIATGRGPADLAAGLYDVYSVGFKGADAMNILSLSAKGANAGLSDTSTTAKVLTGTLNAFGAGGDQAQKYMDVLFQTVNDGAVSFNELSHNLANTAPLASTMGVSVQELGASYAVMTANGIPAAQTETQIASLMRSGINPTTDMSKALNDYGYTSVQSLIQAKGFGGYLQFLNQASGGTAEGLYNLLGSSESVNAALVLGKGDLKGYNKELENMKTASDRVDASGKKVGATQLALDKQMESTAFKLQRLGAVWQVVQIKMSGAFNKPLNMGIDGVTKLLDKFLQLSPGVQKVIAEIAGFTGFTLVAGGAALLAAVKLAEFGNAIKDLTGASSVLGSIGKMASAPFLKMASAMRLVSVEEGVISAGPLLPWLAAAAVVAGAFYLAYKTNFLGIGDLTDKVIGGFKKFGSTVADTYGQFRKLGQNPLSAGLNAIGAGLRALDLGPLNKFRDGIATGLGDAAKFVSKFGNYMKNAFSLGTQVKELARFNPIARGFVGSVGIMAAAAGRLVTAFQKGGWTGLAKEIPNTFRHIGDSFQALDTGIARSIKALGNRFKGLKSITDPLSKAFDDAGFAGMHLAHAFADVLQGKWGKAWENTVDAAKRFGSEVKNLGKAGGAALSKVGDLIQRGVGGAMSYLSNKFPAFNGLWDHLNGVLGGVGGVIKNLGQAFGDLAAGDFGGMFRNLGQAGLDGLKALGNAMGTVPSLIAGVFKSIPWNNVGSALMSGLGKASDLAFKGLNAAGGAIAKGWGGMVNALKNFSWQGVSDALQNGLQSASNLAFKGLNAAAGALGGAWDWIKNAASNIDWGGIADTLTGGLAGAVVGLAKAAAGAAGDLWGWIKDKVDGIDWIGIAVSLGLGIYDAAAGLVKWIEAGATSLWNWIKSLGDKVKDHLPKDPGSLLMDFGKGLANGIKDGFLDAWGAVKSEIENAVNDLIALLNRVAAALNPVLKKLGLPQIPTAHLIGDLGKIQTGFDNARTSATAYANAVAQGAARQAKALDLAAAAASHLRDLVFAPAKAAGLDQRDRGNAPGPRSEQAQQQAPAQPVAPPSTNIGGFVNAQIIKMTSDYASKIQAVKAATSGLIPSISAANTQIDLQNQSMLHTVSTTPQVTWATIALNQGMAAARTVTYGATQGLLAIGQAAAQGVTTIDPLAKSMSDTNQQTELLQAGMLHTIDPTTNMTYSMLAMNAAMGIARVGTAQTIGGLLLALPTMQQFTSGTQLMGIAAGTSFAGIATAAATGLTPLPGILLGAALASTAVAIPAFTGLATSAGVSFASIPLAASLSLGGMVAVVSGTTASAAISAIANTGNMAGGVAANTAGMAVSAIGATEGMAGGVIGSVADMAVESAGSAAGMAAQVGGSAAAMATSAIAGASDAHSGVTGEMIGMAADTAMQTAIAAAATQAAARQMSDAGQRGGFGYALGIELGMSLAVAAAASGASRVASALGAQDLSGAGFSTGSSFSAGVASGILSNLGAIQSAAAQVVSAAAAAAAATAMIHSPSKLFFREIGEPITLGVAGGMTSFKALSAVRNAGGQLIGAARGTLGVSRLPVATGSSRGSTVVNNQQQIVLNPPPGTDNNVIAQQLFNLMIQSQGSAA